MEWNCKTLKFCLQNFLKKILANPLDKSISLWYNKYRKKEREIKKMTELITMGIAIAVLGVIVFLGWLAAKIADFCAERHYAKLRKKHPKLYEMCAERDALANKRHKEWRTRYIDPKAEIDETLKMMPYFTKEKREEEEKHLEELRKTMEDYLREGDPIAEQIEKLQERIKEYASKNNLKNF